MGNMFAKVFSQIFDSTIAEDYKVRHIFMDLLVMADSDGVVDKTPQAISRIANVPLEHVQAALAILSQPDISSRTKDHEGRRIELIDNSRDWGWRLVNFQKYREIRDEEARRIANRSYKRDQRKRQQLSASVPDSQQSQPRSAHTEVEVEVDKELKEQKQKRFSPPTLEEVDSYIQSRSSKVNAIKFWNHYESNGWLVGKNRMKSWKAAVAKWEQDLPSIGGNTNAGLFESSQERRKRKTQEAIDAHLATDFTN